MITAYYVLILQFIFIDSGDLHKMSEKANFQRFVTMNKYGNAVSCSFLYINMVAATNSSEYPAFLFEDLGKCLSGYRFQTAISKTLSFPVVFMSFISTDKQPSTAS